MTTLETVTSELKKANIQTVGAYSQLPVLTYKLIIRILHFGTSVLDDSTLGTTVKEIAVSIALKDGRKPVICESTFKTILK